jgi:hypothetical protein
VIDWLHRHSTRLGLLVGATLLYSAWMTGCTFRFSEIERFPNHQMLARAFAHGRLDIAEQPRVDVVLYEGRRYLYFGPVPAALRTPLAAVGIAIPTGLMVSLLCAVLCLVFAAAVRELDAGDPDRGPPKWPFVMLFALCGPTLFMAVLPSVHHEAILWAALFLLLATVGVLRSFRTGASVRGAAAVGVASALAVGSRVSYLVPACLLIGVLLVIAWKNGSPRLRIRVAAATVAPLLAMLAALAAYNLERFGCATEFGLRHLTSRYQDYIRDGHFWRLDHVPYNLWDYLGRPPQPRPDFPFLEATISMDEVTRRTATPRPPYRLVHVNELAVSVFAVVPMALLLIPALSLVPSSTSAPRRRFVRLCTAVAALQIGVLSLTIASTARYAYDFLPYLVLLSAAGAGVVRERFQSGHLMVVVLLTLSLLIGLFLPLSAVEQYRPFIGYSSPLLELVGGPGPQSLH